MGSEVIVTSVLSKQVKTVEDPISFVLVVSNFMDVFNQEDGHENCFKNPLKSQD